MEAAACAEAREVSWPPEGPSPMRAILRAGVWTGEIKRQYLFVQRHEGPFDERGQIVEPDFAEMECRGGGDSGNRFVRGITSRESGCVGYGVRVIAHRPEPLDLLSMVLVRGGRNIVAMWHVTASRAPAWSRMGPK